MYRLDKGLLLVTTDKIYRAHREHWTIKGMMARRERSIISPFWVYLLLYCQDVPMHSICLLRQALSLSVHPNNYSLDWLQPRNWSML